MTDSTPLDHEELMRRLSRDLIDGYDEELELEIEDRTHEDILAGEAGVREVDDETKAERAAYFKIGRASCRERVFALV